VGKTVITQRVELEIDGRRYRVTLTPITDYYSCVVEKMTEFGWQYVGPAKWEHTNGTYTYPDNMGRGGNE
jgi:hypothetical protein